MAKHISTAELKEKVKQAKRNLNKARKDGLKGSDIKPYSKAVKDAEAILAAAENAFRQSEK